MSKVIVTGGCGFIGSHLVDRLVKEGEDVHVIDNLSANNEIFYKNDNASYYRVDITNFSSIEKIIKGATNVYHLAAESRIGPTIKNPQLACKTNVLGTCNMLVAARDAGVQSFIYSSTSSYYGLKNSPPLHENMLSDNLNPYSSTKIAAEDMCAMFNKLYNMPTISLRYFNVFGDRMPDAGQYAPVLAIFMKQKREGKSCTVVGDGLQSRDFVHVSDVVAANILASKKANNVKDRIFNVGTGKSVTILDLAKIVGNQIDHLPPRDGEAKSTLANITRIKDQLGWEPKIDVIEWFENKNR